MTTVGLVMAGGESSRMAESGIQTPKPLLTVAGGTLLEHNLRAQCRSGVSAVYVAFRQGASQIASAVDQIAASFAATERVPIHPLIENEPLGNIGALGMLPEGTTTAVVTFADNLTALRPALLVDHHRAHGASLTLATHTQKFVMPFGELVVEGSSVRSYTEKPSRDYLVASALTVASDTAIALARDRSPLGLSDLTTGLLDAGEVVESVYHQEPWIDINDRHALAAADGLLTQHAEAFGWFLPAGDTA